MRWRSGSVVADVALRCGQILHSQQKFFLDASIRPTFPDHPPQPYSREYAAQPSMARSLFAESRLGGFSVFVKRKGIYQNTVILLGGRTCERWESMREKTARISSIYNATMHVAG